jgi:HTH-type transcriptional regulator/antitoxin MqsA
MASFQGENRMVKEERCPACGAGELVQETRNMPYVYKGRKTVLADISGRWCPSCGEVFLRNGEIDHYMAALNAFKKEVNATLVDAEYVAAVRKNSTSTSAKRRTCSVAG